jgi:MIP family channel proteins
MKQWQRYLAEFFGTFVLVFGGSTVILAGRAVLGPQNAPLFVELAVPFGFGLALLAGLYAFAEVSGGHFNPAVSLGLFLDRRLALGDLIGYWVAQFAGAIVASAIMLLPFTKSDVAATATVPGVGVSDGAAFALETIFTAIFVAVILRSSKSERYGGSALVAIPLTLVMCHFAIVVFSGCSVNPARTLGPALIGDHWDSEWIYFLGPALGAIIAYVVHSVVVEGDTALRDKTPPPATGEGEAAA